MTVRGHVNHPDYYGGEDNPYEAIKIIEAYDLNFSLGNVIKYVLRAGKKSDSAIEDLEKAARYIQFQIDYLRRQK
jgi:translation initiation factor 2B subunit (eIF-2B alpha/beta/delta family)